MCPTFTLVKALRFRLMALALCSLGGLAITLWPAAEAQEISAPILPHPSYQSRVISSEEPQEALAAPEAAAVTGNPIPIARDGHTATLLSDGRVLVVGGRAAGGGALDSVQIFNPATGQWAPANSLVTPRYGHAAVLLQNGRVLVAGGRSSSNSNSFLRSSEIFNPLTGAWTAGPNLITARAGATATLLPTTASPPPFSNSQSVIPPAPPADARVLLAGGENSEGTLASAELFNPAANGGAGAWSPTRSMTTRRRDHTATLVRGGFVVVTGGRDGQTPLKTVEMFFPNHSPAPIWYKTTDMSSPRFGHTASALNDGRTLVAGGHDGVNFLNSAVIFDSDKRMWTATRNLNTARRSHSATLLASGKVYLAGGFNGSAINTAETYDPATNGWTVEQLSAARSSHTAIMLATGSVLLVAGNTDDGAAVINSTELNDPAVGFWGAAPSNSQPLFVHNSVLLPNGKVLSMGGLGYIILGNTISFISSANARLFDPAANGGGGGWSGAGVMRTDRYLFPATLMRTSEVLVSGGFRVVNGSGAATNSAETYNPSSGAWTLVDSMDTARAEHTATLLPDGRVLVTGGFNSAGAATASAEIYNPSTRLWTPARNMITARTWHRATLLANGRVLVTGGFSTAQNATLQSAEIYNPATDTWTSARQPNFRRDSHTATLLASGQVLLAGGRSALGGLGAPLTSAELYNPVNDSWTTTDHLNGARFSHTATLLPSGKVLLAGGLAGNDAISTNYLASAQIYDPATGGWRTTDNLDAPRSGHTLTLLPDGRVLAIGGARGNYRAIANWLSSAERYNAGLGYAENLRPILSGVEWRGLKGAGSPLRVTGVLLQGGSEAVGGGAQDTATNYPLLQLRSLDSGRTLFLPPGDAAGWSNNFITTRTIVDNAFPSGFALLTAITNGVPSVAQIVETSVASRPSTSQNNTDVGSISGRVTTRTKTPLPNIRITLTRQSSSSCSPLTMTTQTNANGGYSFLALGVNCRYSTTPGPASIGNLPLRFTPTQRNHFLPCNSCGQIDPLPSLTAPNAPEQGDDTDNQQHVPNSDFEADFIANVGGRVTLAANGQGINSLPLTLTPIPPIAINDQERDANTTNNNGSNGSYRFILVALGGHYRLSINNSSATNYEFAYSPPLGAPVPGNSAEIHNVVQNDEAHDFVAGVPLAAPVIAALGATAFTAGGRGFPLTVTGSGFSPNVTQLRWNDQPRATTVNSGSQLTATITEQDIALGGTGAITIVNQSGGQTKTSNAVQVRIEYPLPTINNLNPPSATIGSGPLTLTISGAGFFPTSQAMWRGQPRATAFDPATRNLSIELAPTDLATPGDAEVKVSNPTPGGGVSSPRNFQALGFSIAGALRFSHGATLKLVPGVSVTLSGGSNPVTVTTTNSGAYNFTNLGNGPYVVTVSKTGDVNGISGSDASMVAQAVAETITLSDLQRIAADANGSGAISAQDASLIARFAAEIPDSTSIAGTWKFNQSSRTHNPLNSNLTGQDFEAVLVGDVTRSWTPPNNVSSVGPVVRDEPLPSFGSTGFFDFKFDPTPKLLSEIPGGGQLSLAQAINVSAPPLSAASGASLTIPITTGDLTERGVTAYDFTLVFDQNVLQPQTPAYDLTGTISSAMTVFTNTATPGRLRLVAFGTDKLAGAGTLLNLKFNVIGAVGASSPLTLQTFTFNEGDPQANRTSGGVTVIGPPVVTTAAATEIGANSARLNGAANPNGGAATAFFEWAVNSDLSNPNVTAQQSLAAGSAAQTVSAAIPGLNPGTTYFFRLVATNNAGATRGAILNFTTPAACPAIAGINPASGAAGSIVTITGTNFTGITSVRFNNNVAATPANLSDTSFTVAVPAGAVNGPITIGKTGCPDAQTSGFTVLLPQTTLSFGVPALTVLAGSSQAVVLRLGSAQNSDTLVQLSSTNPAVASAPATITIGAGVTEASVNVTGAAVGGPVTITATLPAALGGGSASLTANVAGAGLRIVNASGPAGGTANVRIELVSAGGVNALGFSLQFNPAVLSNPRAVLDSDAANARLQTNGDQTAQGRLGLLAALPSGQSFAAGTRQVVAVSFTVAANAAGVSTPINFSDQPTRQEVSDTGANNLLAVFIPGSVTVTPAPPVPEALEADVTPRPTGNGEVTSDDLAQIARFVVGLDTPGAGSEFQRADCAPRLAQDGVTLLRGDGRLTVRDWVLAERYQAGLEPPTAPGGPVAFGEMGLMGEMGQMGQRGLAGEVANAASLRTLRVAPYGAGMKRSHSIVVEINALGGETAFSFSLSFDPARWRVTAAVVGQDLKSARLLLNTAEASGGRVGIALALPPGESLSAGGRQLAAITFVSLSPGGAEFDSVGFTDEPAAREVTDGEANLLPANFALNNDLPLAVFSSADFNLAALASESLATAFGRDLAAGTLTAETLPLPTTLGGAQVVVRDSLGAERLAPILFVSPGQINFQVPAETAPGLAVVTITGENQHRAVAVVEIKPSAPALFTGEASGHGLAAGMVMRMRNDGPATLEPAMRFDPSSKKFIAAPIYLRRDQSEGEEQVFLLLFGTGIRHGRTKSVTIAGAPAELTYAGAQNGFAGLDQINILLTRDLGGRGEVDVVLIVDGQKTLPVRVHFR